MAHRLTEGAWTWPDHLDLLSQKLVDVAMGRCRRLIVTMPPQNGKSSLVAHWFPVWLLNLYMTWRVVFVSYAADYASEWGRKVRNTIAEHADDLDVRLSADSGAADKWETTEGGGMVSVGRDGSVTGRRANVLIFDDPIKNAEEAASKGIRDKIWEFFLTCAYTRLTPDGAIIVVQTRWHEDDLVGRLLEEAKNGGEQWEVINLPAIAEANDPLGRPVGAPLWPQRWPLAALERIKRALGTFRWNALYQQRPTAPEGNVFKRAWFTDKIVDSAPRDGEIVRYWDLAATKEKPSKDPDYAAGCRMVMTADHKFYITDMQHFRDSAAGVEERVKLVAQLDGREVSIRIEQEPGSASKLYINSLASGPLVSFDVRGVPSSTDKVTRARPFSAACERGDVYIVRGEWNAGFIDELCSFPSGAHDDQVDAATGAFNHLAGDGEQWTADDWKATTSYEDH